MNPRGGRSGGVVVVWQKPSRPRLRPPRAPIRRPLGTTAWAAGSSPACVRVEAGDRLRVRFARIEGSSGPIGSTRAYSSPSSPEAGRSAGSRNPASGAGPSASPPRGTGSFACPSLALANARAAAQRSASSCSRKAATWRRAGCPRSSCTGSLTFGRAETVDWGFSHGAEIARRSVTCGTADRTRRRGRRISSIGCSREPSDPLGPRRFDGAPEPPQHMIAGVREPICGRARRGARFGPPSNLGEKP